MNNKFFDSSKWNQYLVETSLKLFQSKKRISFFEAMFMPTIYSQPHNNVVGHPSHYCRMAQSLRGIYNWVIRDLAINYLGVGKVSHTRYPLNQHLPMNLEELELLSQGVIRQQEYVGYISKADGASFEVARKIGLKYFQHSNHGGFIIKVNDSNLRCKIPYEEMISEFMDYNQYNLNSLLLNKIYDFLKTSSDTTKVINIIDLVNIIRSIPLNEQNTKFLGDDFGVIVYAENIGLKSLKEEVYDVLIKHDSFFPSNSKQFYFHLFNAEELPEGESCPKWIDSITFDLQNGYGYPSKAYLFVGKVRYPFCSSPGSQISYLGGMDDASMDGSVSGNSIQFLHLIYMLIGTSPKKHYSFCKMTEKQTEDYYSLYNTSDIDSAIVKSTNFAIQCFKDAYPNLSSNIDKVKNYLDSNSKYLDEKSTTFFGYPISNDIYSSCSNDNMVRQQQHIFLNLNSITTAEPILPPGSYKNFFLDLYNKDNKFVIFGKDQVRNPMYILDKDCFTEVEAELLGRMYENRYVDALGFNMGIKNGASGLICQGGTTGNYFAIKLASKYLQKHHDQAGCEIVGICSNQAHYSVYKIFDSLGIKNIITDSYKEDNPELLYGSIDIENLIDQIKREQEFRKEHDLPKVSFIVLLTIGTTTIGANDMPEKVVTSLKEKGLIAGRDFTIVLDCANHGAILNSPAMKEYGINGDNIEGLIAITTSTHKVLGLNEVGSIVVVPGYVLSVLDINTISNCTLSKVRELSTPIVLDAMAGYLGSGNSQVGLRSLMSYWAQRIKNNADILSDELKKCFERIKDKEIRYYFCSRIFRWGGSGSVIIAPEIPIESFRAWKIKFHVPDHKGTARYLPDDQLLSFDILRSKSVFWGCNANMRKHFTITAMPNNLDYTLMFSELENVINEFNLVIDQQKNRVELYKNHLVSWLEENVCIDKTDEELRDGVYVITPYLLTKFPNLIEKIASMVSSGFTGYGDSSNAEVSICATVEMGKKIANSSDTDSSLFRRDVYSVFCDSKLGIFSSASGIEYPATELSMYEQCKSILKQIIIQGARVAPASVFSIHDGEIIVARIAFPLDQELVIPGNKFLGQMPELFASLDKENIECPKRRAVFMSPETLIYHGFMLATNRNLQIDKEVKKKELTKVLRAVIYLAMLQGFNMYKCYAMNRLSQNALRRSVGAPVVFYAKELLLNFNSLSNNIQSALVSIINDSIQPPDLGTFFDRNHYSIAEQEQIKALVQNIYSYFNDEYHNLIMLNDYKGVRFLKLPGDYSLYKYWDELPLKSFSKLFLNKSNLYHRDYGIEVLNLDMRNFNLPGSRYSVKK